MSQRRFDCWSHFCALCACFSVCSGWNSRCVGHWGPKHSTGGRGGAAGVWETQSASSWQQKAEVKVTALLLIWDWMIFWWGGDVFTNNGKHTYIYISVSSMGPGRSDLSRAETPADKSSGCTCKSCVCFVIVFFHSYFQHLASRTFSRVALCFLSG